MTDWLAAPGGWGPFLLGASVAAVQLAWIRWVVVRRVRYELTAARTLELEETREQVRQLAEKRKLLQLAIAQGEQRLAELPPAPKPGGSS